MNDLFRAYVTSKTFSLNLSSPQIITLGQVGSGSDLALMDTLVLTRLLTKGLVKISDEQFYTRKDGTRRRMPSPGPCREYRDRGPHYVLTKAGELCLGLLQEARMFGEAALAA